MFLTGNFFCFFGLFVSRDATRLSIGTTRSYANVFL